MFKTQAGPSGPPLTTKGRTTYKTGAQRGSSVAGESRDVSKLTPRYDLISPIALRRLAETHAEGADRYGQYNWRAGMPFTDTLNHCLAHINAYLTGDKSEDHLAHAAWNLFALMHFEETHPEMNDLKVDDYKPKTKSIQEQAAEYFTGGMTPIERDRNGSF